MAKYTMELRDVCRLYGEEEVLLWFSSYNLEDYLTHEQIEVITNHGTWNKEKLARKILNHYYTREIGAETPALFRHFTKNTMAEIMEVKLPLIYSRCINYDVLLNVNYEEIFEKGTSSNANTSVNSSNTSNGLSINSVPNQGEVLKSDILSGKYATDTSAGENENNSEETSSSEEETNENYVKKIKGNNNITAQKMIEQYRNNIIAIDNDIIEELNILFMGIY